METDPRAAGFSGFVAESISTPAGSPSLQNNSLPPGLTVFVIGASTGIGEHVAYAYAAAGATNLLIASRDATVLTPVFDRISQISPGTNVHTASVDIADEQAVAGLAERIQADFGKLDVLVLNAGYSNPNANICRAPPHEVRKAFDINTLGSYNIVYYLCPLLAGNGRARGGQLLTIGSGSSALRRGPFSNPGYSISKLAQARIMEYLAEQYPVDKLFVVTIDPGTVLTRMSRSLVDPQYAHVLKDDVGLGGATCVWLTVHQEGLAWLHGRFIYATWQPEALLRKKDEVIGRDLLKFGIYV